ncbi:unnamed protein product [Cuscuta europaea]|uniref:Phytocyanin domain-containing protein n=1 Tax=Cuscuta europaea TaxID=41803 RepID=A0A9P0ZPL6_CUSEU|nr:unnamed protein product [Cuscuta europaea]
MDKIMILMVVLGSVIQYGGAQTVHLVGDNIRWSIPPFAAAYSNWTSCNIFKVGDILEFDFKSGEHNVVEVSRDSFETCTTNIAISAPITDGPARLTLNSTGDHFYICSVGSHCLLGQKLAITVVSDATTPPAPNSCTPPSPPTSPASPAPSPSVPSPSNPATGPSDSTAPSDGATDPPKSDNRSSSSAMLHAGLALTWASIALAYIYSS